MVTNGFPPSAYGGVETYTQDLSHALRRMGHEIIVFCRESNFSLPDTRILDQVEAGLRVVRVVNDYKQIASVEQTFLDRRIGEIFRDILQGVKPDLIHFQHLIALSADLPAIAAQEDVPFITTLHDFWPICQRVNLLDWRQSVCEGPLKADCHTCVAGGPAKPAVSAGAIPVIRMVKMLIPVRLRRRARLWLSRQNPVETPRPVLVSTPAVFARRLDLFKQSILLSRRILAPSQYLRSQYIRNGFPQRIEVVSLGIPSPGSVKPVLPSQGIVFGTIGSMIPIKGFHVLIHAFMSVPNPDARLHLYGREDVSPEYVSRLKESARQDPRIQFMGPFSPDLRQQVYEKVDVIVIPSLVPETFSLVAHEALQSHKPVIASRLGALSELVVDNVNGVLFQAGDEGELSAVLSRFLEDPKLIQRMDLPGPVRIVSIPEHAGEMTTIYQQTIEC
jgi:glycosyltransferase involved in cell wall biosynthesis